MRAWTYEEWCCTHEERMRENDDLQKKDESILVHPLFKVTSRYRVLVFMMILLKV